MATPHITILVTSLLLPGLTLAQDTAPEEDAAPVEPDAETPPPPDNAEMVLIEQRLRELQEQMAELQQRVSEPPPPHSPTQEEEAIDALIAEGEEELSVEQGDPLNLYGFLDVGLQHLFVPETSFINVFAPTDASTFVLGNVNLFLDAHPIDSVRGLVEVRFTTLPHGQETSLGTPLGGEYTRVDREVTDATSPSGRNSVIAGSIILERAWLQWTHSDVFELRVGSWLTPYGIWNTDHGTPTLTSLLLPNSQVTQAFPLRQLGIQARGSFPQSPHPNTATGSTSPMAGPPVRLTSARTRRSADECLPGSTMGRSRSMWALLATMGHFSISRSPSARSTP